jgi:hypothetical protein
MRRNGGQEPPSRSVRHSRNEPPPQHPTRANASHQPFIGVLWVGYLAKTGVRGGDAAEHLFESL